MAACDAGGVLAGHTRDIAMFDVPPPSRGVEGLKAYAETWPPFFEWLARNGRFTLARLTVEADRSAGFAHEHHSYADRARG